MPICFASSLNQPQTPGHIGQTFRHKLLAHDSPSYLSGPEQRVSIRRALVKADDKGPPVGTDRLVLPISPD
jgi:hypothetical protein